MTINYQKKYFSFESMCVYCVHSKPCIKYAESHTYTQRNEEKRFCSKRFSFSFYIFLPHSNGIFVKITLFYVIKLENVVKGKIYIVQ